MGAALDAIGDVGTALRNSPILIAGAAIAGVILLFGSLLTFIPLIGQLIFGIVIAPIVLVGLATMANAAVEGSASLSSLFDGMSEHAGDAIGAYAILFAIYFVVTFTLVIVALVAGIGVFSLFAAGGTGDPGSDLGAVAGGSIILFVLIMLVFFIVAMILALIQNFLDVSVAIGGYGGMDAVREATGLIKEAPLSTLGYLFVRAAVTIVAGIVPFALFFFGFAMTLDGGSGGSLAGVGVVAMVVSVLLLPLPFAASFAYHAAYYRRRRGVPHRQAATDTAGRERRHGQPDDPMGD